MWVVTPRVVTECFLGRRLAPANGHTFQHYRAWAKPNGTGPEKRVWHSNLMSQLKEEQPVFFQGSVHTIACSGCSFKSSFSVSFPRYISYILPDLPMSDSLTVIKDMVVVVATAVVMATAANLRNTRELDLLRGEVVLLPVAGKVWPAGMVLNYFIGRCTNSTSKKQQQQQPMVGQDPFRLLGCNLTWLL